MRKGPAHVAPKARMRRSRNLLPFIGLIAFACMVAALGGVGGTFDQPAAETTLITPLAPKPLLGAAEPAVAAEGDDGVAVSSPVLARVATASINTGWNAAVPLKNAAGNTTACGSTWSGGSDAAGLVYHACAGHSIHQRGPKGALKTVIATGETAPVGRRDVAPNAAGTVVYYSVGDRVDTDLTSTQLAAGWGSVHRMKLNASGVWVRDTKFAFGPFKLYGLKPWSARYLTVGSDGILYASTNAFVMAIDNVGRVRADEYGQYDAAGTKIGPAIGGYDQPAPAADYNVVEGLAMSADGTKLYAAEEDYDYITRFTRDAKGAWIADRIAGTPGTPTATCSDSKLAAPYDIGVTAAGSVLVANTTCAEVRLYDADLVQKGTVLTGLSSLPHGVAVAGNGALILPWRNEIYTRR
jgi:hypothetical protein